MTEKKSVFAIKQQHRPFPSDQFALKNGRRSVVNLEAVVDALSDRPKDITISRNQQPNVLLLPFRKLLIHKEIAKQFGAFHTQGIESVAMPPMAQGQGKTELFEIQLCHFWRFINDKTFCFIKSGETKMDG